MWGTFAGKFPGDRSERSFILKVSNYSIHIHHWIWCSLLLLLITLIKYYNPLLLGLLIGSIIQGLIYKDRFVIIYKSSDYKKIYSKFIK